MPREEWDTLVEEIELREKMQEQGEHVKEIGGLHVIGTERHEARRIDLQLRGRCGRQGDPGSSRFYLSLKDDLMRIFAGPWVEKILKSLGMPEGEPIESRMVTRRIEAAQKKVEERNFEIRKNLLEYDEVMDEQRKRVYSYRQAILDGANCKDLILTMVEQQVDHQLGIVLARDYGCESFATWSANRLAVTFEPRDFRGMDFDSAESFAKDEAERMAESQVMDAIDENLPKEEESDDWNWEALAKLANSRWGTNLRDRDLKKVGRDRVDELLVEKAREAIRDTDLSDGAKFLETDYGTNAACAWVKYKFGIEIDPSEVTDAEPAQFIDLVKQRAIEAYDEKESEYAVMAGMYRFSSSAGGHARVDRERLIDWARDRFEADLTLEDVKNKQRDEIRALLVGHSRAHLRRAEEATDQVRQKIAKLFGDAEDETLAQVAGGNGALASLRDWLEQTLHVRLPAEDLEELNREQLERKLLSAVDDRYRPEMRRMERAMVLQIVDSAWKEHLLAMDHLRSSVSLVGYAQVDPKVEYKREGMKLYEQMWDALGQRTTDLIFRMEQLDEGFVSSTWVETAAVHEEGPTATEMARQQDEAIANSQDAKIETIRNVGQRVGRNEPCPCGSGKKYKNCCMRTKAGVQG